MAVISVIIPVYNTDTYLEECLESVLSQTFYDFEVILIDDGSTDRSSEICDRYALRDSRISAFHKENQGQAAARNYGVIVSNTQWIAFVDADDVIHPQYLEYLYRGIQEFNTEISICGYASSEYPHDFLKTRYEYVSRKIDLNEKDYYAQYLEDKLFDDVVWRLLISKNLLIKYPFEKGRIHEDTAVVCRWFTEAKALTMQSAQMYFYRTNPNGTMSVKFDSPGNIDILWAFNQKIDCYLENGYYTMVKCWGGKLVKMMTGQYVGLKRMGAGKGEIKLVKKEYRKLRRKCKDCLEYAGFSEEGKEWFIKQFHPIKFFFMNTYRRLKFYGFAGSIKKCFQKIFGQSR